MGEQINARDWVIEVSDGAAIPVWAEVDGLNSFTLNEAENEESVDTTVFSNQGIHSSQAMQRGASLSVEGMHITDGAGAQDPGQAQVETLAGKVGNASLGGVRFRHISQTEWTVWRAWASLAEKGGGNNDKSTWGATLMRSGAATTEAVAA